MRIFLNKKLSGRTIFVCVVAAGWFRIKVGDVQAHKQTHSQTPATKQRSPDVCLVACDLLSMCLFICLYKNEERKKKRKDKKPTTIQQSHRRILFLLFPTTPPYDCFYFLPPPLKLSFALTSPRARAPQGCRHLHCRTFTIHGGISRTSCHIHNLQPFDIGNACWLTFVWFGVLQ